MSQFREYVEAGFALCVIPPGSKGPTYKHWNTPERAITNVAQLNGAQGVGLLHSLSGTAALDIDNLPEARTFFAAQGLDLDALLAAPDGVQISSGRPNRAKLLYRMPSPLASHKLAPYTVVNLATGKPKTYHAIELRCASADGASVQDVLPGTIHPTTGKPYVWKFAHPLLGSWRNLPDIPPSLLALWQSQETPQEPAEAAALPAPAETASISELRSYLEYHDPDGTYDDWVAVGMALHDSTGGDTEGLLLWDEWSRKGSKYGEAKSGMPPQYPTDKWHTFTAGHGYTVGFLKSKAPAAIESFPEVPEEFKTEAGKEPDVGTDVRPGAIVRRALAPLVFVSSQGSYFDTERRLLLNRDSIDDLYTPLMPVLHITGANGASKPYVPKPREELRKAAWKEVVHGVGMHPGEGKFFTENNQRFLNTYDGAPAAPIEPTSHERDAFNFIWSRPDEGVFRDWLLKFFAHAVQNPGVKITSAPLLVGHATGSGKNTLMKIIPQLLFTPRYVTTMTNQILQGQFSDQLVNAWWVYFEELHSGNNKGDRIAVSNRVKSWITDDTVVIRPMFGKAYDAPNRIQVTASSNYEDDAIHVDDADRRWVMGHIDRSMTDREAGDLYAFLESPRAPGVLRHIFNEVSLTDFNPRSRAPETLAKRIMVRVNYGHWESELLEMISAGTPPFDKDILEVKDIMPYVKAGGITTARLGRIVQRPPFNFVQLASAYGKRLWAWRNVEMWKTMGPALCSEYHDGIAARPPGWGISDQLPAALAEACGFEPAPASAGRPLLV